MGQDLLSLISGALVGGVLSLIGGGGSILAVPLLVYVVGVKSPHIAIGTSAVAVALSSLTGLIGHARIGNVRWPCALVFTATGIVGATLGSSFGKRVDGQRLLFMFGLLMIVVAGLMFWRKSGQATNFVRLTRATAPTVAPRLAGFGLAAGAAAGFFGIGGGFLVVPGLIAATEMPLIMAIGSSLVAVTAFGLTTAANYAASDLIDWRLVALFVAGGVVGSLGGRRYAVALAGRKDALTRVFAAIVAGAGLYIAGRSLFG